MIDGVISVLVFVAADIDSNSRDSRPIEFKQEMMLKQLVAGKLQADWIHQHKTLQHKNLALNFKPSRLRRSSFISAVSGSLSNF